MPSAFLKALDSLSAAFIAAAANLMTTLLRGYREMREALEPFAKEAALWPDYVPGSDGLFIASPDDIEPILDEYAAEQGRATAGISFSSDTVTVGDLRRALAALQSTGGKEQKEETPTASADAGSHTSQK